MGDDPNMEQQAEPEDPREATAAQARAATDATFDDADGLDGAAHRMPLGMRLLSGDVGPKGDVAANHRRLSRDTSMRGELVPRGTSIPGGGRLILGTVLLVVGLAGLAVFILIALTS